VQVNYAGITRRNSTIGMTLVDGFVGIDNAAANDPEAMPANETAAHEVIHSRLIAKDPNAEAYYKLLRDNVLVGSEVFGVYMAAINKGYFDGNFDYTNEEHRAKFFDELSAYVAGHIYANTHDVQPMLADYAAVRTALEKALRTKIETRDTGTRYSLKTDSDYLAAVERGDMDTAQRMVDEAAKAAGYNSLNTKTEAAMLPLFFISI